MIVTKLMERSIIKFTPIITLKNFDFSFELSFNIVAKVNKSGERLRFVFKWKDPSKVSVIIKQEEMIFVTRCAQNRRCPYISMNNIKISNSIIQ